jgi:hypothetical protein
MGSCHLHFDHAKSASFFRGAKQGATGTANTLVEQATPRLAARAAATPRALKCRNYKTKKNERPQN